MHTLYNIITKIILIVLLFLTIRLWIDRNELKANLAEIDLILAQLVKKSLGNSFSKE